MTLRALLLVLAAVTALAQVVGGPPTPLPGAIVGLPYGPLAINLPSCSGQCTGYNVNLGTLPPGLTVNPATGTLSGTPTQTGAFTFQVVANVSPQIVAGGAFSLTVAPPTQGAPISTPTLLVAMTGLAATGIFLMRRPAM